MVEATAFGNLSALVAVRTEQALRDDSTGAAAQILGLIAAAGVGPVLPIRLLAAALSNGGPLPPLGQIRDTVVPFGALISRGNPGTDREKLGIAHLSLLDPIITDVRRRGILFASAHQALIRGHRRLMDAEPGAAQDESLQNYWTIAAPHHYLESGNSNDAVRFLASLDTSRAADNRDRWATWLPAFAATAGADHPDTVYVRNILNHWQAVTGDTVQAVAPPTRPREEAPHDSEQTHGGDDHGTSEPPTPWYRTPAAIGAAATSAALLPLLVWAVIRTTSIDSAPPSPVTDTLTQTETVVQTETVSGAPQTVTESARPTTITNSVTQTVTAPASTTTVAETTTITNSVTQTVTAPASTTTVTETTTIISTTYVAG